MAASSNAKPCPPSSPQLLVSREPVYDRKLKVHRPRKKSGKRSQPKFF